MSGDISLNSFAKRYKRYQGKITKRTLSKPVVIMFSPEVKSSTLQKDEFWRYAYISLLKYKPWDQFKESVFGGQISTASEFKDISEEVKTLILHAFTAFFRTPGTPTYLTDNRLQRAIEEALDNDEVELHTQLSAFSIDEGNEFDLARQGALFASNDDEFNDQIQWDKQFDHTITRNEYAPNEITKEEIQKKYKTLNSATSNVEKRQIHLTDFETDQHPGKDQQKNVINVFLDIVGLQKNSQGEFQEPRRLGTICSNAMLVPGPAGTGKSHIIDCLDTELVERYREKYGKEGFVLRIAPTGKAALGIGGYTMQSSQGLSVPVHDLSTLATHRYKGGDALSSLQKRLNYRGAIDADAPHLIAVVVDEYSMISSLQMFWISERLKQGVNNEDECFGGVPIVFFGDPAQLPPVGGSPLWAEKTSDKKPLTTLALQGNAIYKGIATVSWLTHVRRQEGQFKDFLGRLRNGENTEDDWHYLNDNCSKTKIFAESQERLASFHSSETTWIFETNDACNTKNIDQLKRLRTPINCIQAEHDDNRFRSKGSEYCRRLVDKLYLAVGAKVMLLWNINLAHGLVNGSNGEVIDFIYTDGEKAPQLPFAIIINFPDYTGPPFFSEAGREKWVPLLAQTYEFTEGFKSHFRKQFPISLSWALTAWKAQGLTCNHNVYAVIGDSEKTTGLTYVILSRNTKIKQLCIGDGITLQRLTTAISESKALKLRLKEDTRLHELWRQTKMVFDLGE
jgi:hypothetical protein